MIIFLVLAVYADKFLPQLYYLHFFHKSRLWIFLPRKSSESVPYTPKSDEVQGSNLLLVANEDFSEINVRTVGDIEPEYGFSSLRKLPGTAQTYVAIKVKELSDPPVTQSKVVIFDLDGKVHSVTPIPGTFKFEGIEFV